MASRDCFPTVDVESSDFGLGCQGYDCLDDLGDSRTAPLLWGQGVLLDMKKFLPAWLQALASER